MLEKHCIGDQYTFLFVEVKISKTYETDNLLDIYCVHFTK